MGDIITEVAKYQKGWKGGLPETRCGSGSKISNTVEQRDWLPDIVERYGIKSIADIGAGDLNWMKLVDWDVEYNAYDLVPRHKDVVEFDILKDDIPKAECILLLWVLNHFPFDHCEAALDKVIGSGAKYLIMTDRPIWREEQPPAICMPYIEELVLNEKGDRILLIDLEDLGRIHFDDEEDDDDQDSPS